MVEMQGRECPNCLSLGYISGIDAYGGVLDQLCEMCDGTGYVESDGLE